MAEDKVKPNDVITTEPISEEAKATKDITLTLNKNEQVAVVAALRFLQIMMSKAPGFLRGSKEVETIEKDAIPGLLTKLSKATGHGGSYDKELKF